MPRFVVLEHDHPTLHWDWMLEDGESLLTWRLEEPPQSESAIAATALAAHRLAYLDYEGPVSRNRGTVKRWDAGSFIWLVHAADLLQVQIAGNRLRGNVEMCVIESQWRFRYREEGTR